VGKRKQEKNRVKNWEKGQLRGKRRTMAGTKKEVVIYKNCYKHENDKMIIKNFFVQI